MTIESLFTTQSGLTLNTTSSINAPQTLGSPLNFLELILGKLQEINNNQATSSAITSAPQIKKSLLKTDGFSDPSLLSNTQNTDLLISENPDVKPDLLLVQSLQIDPGQDGNTLTQNLQSKIKTMIAKSDHELITTNLTPEQITALLTPEQITALLTPEQITALTIAPEIIIPEEIKNIKTIVIELFSPPQENTALDLSDDPTLANALTVLTPQQPVKKFTPLAISNEETIASKINALTPGTGVSSEMNLDDLSEFSDTFKLSEYIKNAKLPGQDIGQNLNPNTHPNPQQNNNVLTNSLGVLTGFSTLMPEGLFYSGSDSLNLYNDMNLNAVAAQPFYSGSPAGLVTHAMATTAHPATQAVIMNIQKAANSGQDKTLSLTLDPPELGRIEVRLSFSKDKTMKAHLIAEKPETYMMLQRDSETLQRALSESGLESDNGLSFELAENGFDFQQNNERGGGHDSDGTGSTDQNNSDEEIIHSTMTWHVDPLTGHMRYDILV